MQASALLLRWGSYRWAHNLWVLIIYLLFLPVMFPSVVPRLATDLAVRVFPGVWKLLFLRLPSWDGALSLPLLSLFLSFIFFPTSFWRQWAAFLGAWCPLPAFRSCFVEFTRRLNALLMNLWGRKCSPRPTPPPSWLLPPDSYFIQVHTYISLWLNVSTDVYTNVQKVIKRWRIVMWTVLDIT